MQRSDDAGRLRHGPVLACDLDGTLVSVNTFPRFVLFSLWRLPLERRVGAWLHLVLALARRKLLGAPHALLKEAVHDASTSLSHAAVRRWADRLLARTARPAVVQLVREWHGGTVLCTAAPQPYATHFGELLGFDVVQGSARHAGLFVENVAAEKAFRLQSTLTGPLDCAVTDDARIDGPLLMLARRRLVVGPAGHLADVGPPR